MKVFFAYKYSGKPCRLSAHGWVEPGDEIWLNEFERVYQKEHANKDFVYLKKTGTAEDFRKSFLAKLAREAKARDEKKASAEPSAPGSKPRPVTKFDAIKELNRNFKTRQALFAHASSLGLNVTGNPSRDLLVGVIAQHMIDPKAPASPVDQQAEAEVAV